MSRGLVKHYSWVCLWRGFWKRSAFESVEWVKITLTSVSGHHPTHLGPSWDKKAKEGQILSFSSWTGTSIFSCPWKSELLVYSGLRMTGLTPCPPHLQFPGIWLQTGIYTASFPGSHAFGQRLNYTISFLGFPACECQVLHPLSLHNCVSQFLCYISYIYLSVRVYINILFVLFLWENSNTHPIYNNKQILSPCLSKNSFLSFLVPGQSHFPLPENMSWYVPN